MKNRFTLLFLLILISSKMFSQENVELLSTFKPSNSDYSDIWGYVDENNREYAILGNYNGTYIIDVTDPQNPEQISFIDGPNSIWRDMKVHDKYAYVVTEGFGSGSGMQIIDLSNLPNSAVLVNTYNSTFTSAHNIFIDNGFAYVIGTSGVGGMHILDLSNPTNPVEKSYYTASGYIHDVYVWSDTVVVCAEDNYALVDVTDKSNPVKISQSVNLPGYAHSGWMTEDKKYFYGTDEFNQRDITIFNLEDKTTWEIAVGSWGYPQNTIIHNLFIDGDYAHISYYESGYVILNISDPENPIIAGYYDTYPQSNNSSYNGAWGCYPFLPSGNILVSDIQGGLFVLKFSPDDIKPQIEYSNNYFEVFNSNPVNISAKFIDDSEITESNLFYRTLIDDEIGNWQIIEGITQGKFGVYNFQIPGQEHLTKIEFYFAAKDNMNQVTTLPSGGEGLNPAGSVPPSEFFSYRVVIAGTPVINQLSHNFTDTTIVKGEKINFSVSAEDTTSLPIKYKWIKNDQTVSQKEDYTYSTTFVNPPVTDTVKLIITNDYKSIEKIYIINVEQTTTVKDEPAELKYELTQNYPNPFNPSTQIVFSVPSDGFVELKIYNLMGEEIKNLVSGVKAKGKYSVTFDAENLSSGIYIAQLRAESFIQTIKMNLIK
ncbi:MAG: hypothetical protein CMF23_15020 [Ignavibacteriae bacterium]|nr:hypothetical protein [Ignavibacteriota bacterium]